MWVSFSTIVAFEVTSLWLNSILHGPLSSIFGIETLKYPVVLAGPVATKDISLFDWSKVKADTVLLLASEVGKALLSQKILIGFAGVISG